MKLMSDGSAAQLLLRSSNSISSFLLVRVSITLLTLLSHLIVTCVFRRILLFATVICCLVLILVIWLVICR